jgi:hypothetical protein
MKTNTLPFSQKFLRPAGWLGLLVCTAVPALANSVAQDQALDNKLGIISGNWNLPPAPPATTPPTGGAIAPTQIKGPLPPSQQQPMPPPPPPPRVRPT